MLNFYKSVVLKRQAHLQSGQLASAEEYGLIWITSDLISVAIVIGIFIFQKWKMSGMRSYNPEQIMLSAVVRRPSRDVNLMKEKLIFSGGDQHGGFVPWGRDSDIPDLRLCYGPCH
ncbi:glycerophosphodiester phosphodiesterase domain-containing protein 5-like [Labeo rohita]|uniref:glycerophosphodiester phosphodiesterase domain-containing protein 5-like n=1 Tax=Labeo rohita TaxID=84645 RepID=UPI0021E26AD8|nr:glycerophosphodiester phosphodiesterase domain-containing protein 5-like [Labeo rohita]